MDLLIFCKETPFQLGAIGTLKKLLKKNPTMSLRIVGEHAVFKSSSQRQLQEF